MEGRRGDLIKYMGGCSHDPLESWSEAKASPSVILRKSFLNWKDDRRISVGTGGGGNAEIATPFCGRARNDRAR